MPEANSLANSLIFLELAIHSVAMMLQLPWRRPLMFGSARHPVTNFYPVEVSGWDASEVFFVEKSELEWDEAAGKQVVLHRMLREGAHVFVRLMQSSSSERSYPVPYEARYAGSTADGHWQFRLLAVKKRVDQIGPALMGSAPESS